MEETPENGKESPHSAHANGMNDNCALMVELKTILKGVYFVCLMCNR
jgi:hypothetical protein